MGNTLRNPFSYVFQVAAMLTRCEFLLGCRSATASWKHDIGRFPIPLSDPGDMCLVDKISSPSFTANLREQPWMTSAHVTLPEDLKVKPTPLYSSGQCSSEMGNTLRNPFLYVFQVSRYLPTACYRSDDRFLLLLPCPLCLECLVARLKYIPVNILLCGDVEANPGLREGNIDGTSCRSNFFKNSYS
ncbi:hypothetical protein MTO96_052358 [Rhipicephalus appendiculatus]